MVGTVESATAIATVTIRIHHGTGSTSHFFDLPNEGSVSAEHERDRYYEPRMNVYPRAEVGRLSARDKKQHGHAAWSVALKASNRHSRIRRETELKRNEFSELVRHAWHRIVCG